MPTLRAVTPLNGAASGNFNFYHETLDNRDEKGNITVDFPSLSHGATRALRLAPRRRDNYASQLEVEITAAAAQKP